MTKKTFIKKLREKLSVLDNEEVKDIIEEYEATIDEKIQNGESEKKAIEDFGDIDELAKEILKAYKINPKYTEDNKNEAADNFEEVIKKGATKLSNFTKNVVEDIKSQDGEFTIETIFEIILKSIALLLIIGVLRLPFWILTGIGESLLDVFFFPLDKVLIVIWHLLMWIVYFASCVLIAIAIFKNNIKSNNVKKKETVNREIKKEEKEQEKDKVIETKKEVSDKTSNGILTVFIIIAKVFITLFITIPLILISIALSLAIAVMVYYCFVGINFVGPICIALAFLIIVGYIADVFGNIFKNKKRHFLAPIIISAVFLVLGITFTFIKIQDYRYYDHLDNPPFEMKTEIKEFTIEHPTIIESYNTEKRVDETLENGIIRLEYIYCDKLIEVHYNERKNRIQFYWHNNVEYNERVKLYNEIIDNLKKDRIYNYSELFEVKITIYGNRDTLKLITVE